MATNQVQVFNPAAARPAFATKGELSTLVKSLMGSGSVGNRISVKGGVFRLLSEGKEIAAIEERYLDVVIVAAAPKVSRTFYAGTYDEANPAPPECWSANGEVPDATAHSKQAASCATCPMNIKGSGQGDSRACRYSQRLAVVLADQIDEDVLQLTLAATSIFGKAEGDNRPLQDYVRFHAAQGNDISMMVTRMRFDTTAAVPKLFFKAMRWLSDDEYATTVEKGASPEAVKAITMTVAQQDNVPVAQTVAGPKPTKPAAKPAPVAAPEEDEEPPVTAPKKGRPAKAAPKEYGNDGEEALPEPEVKKPAKTAAKPAVSADVAAVLGDWDDEG